MLSAPRRRRSQLDGRTAWFGFVPATLPKQTTVTAWCLEVHDLVLAKLAAGRQHDFEFAITAVREELVDPDQLELGIELMPTKVRAAVSGRLRRVREETADAA